MPEATMRVETRRMQGRLARSLLLGAALACSAFPSASFAQSTDDDLRRDLLVQADQAREAGDHARALDLATRAGQLRMTPSLSLMLAQEHEQLGHVVEALHNARRCVTDANADATLRNRERIQRLCTDLVAALEGHVARVTLRVSETPEGTTVQVANRSLPPAVWGVAVPVDPGDVEVRVQCPDGRSYARTLHLASGANEEVVVTLSAAPSAATVIPTPEAATPRPVEVRIDPSPRARSGSGPGVGPWVLAGVGVVALGSAGLFWALHGSAVTERDAACDANGCDPSSVDANARAQTFTTAANVGLALGGAALVGGAVWFLVARSRTSEVPAVRPSAWLSPVGAGVALGGTL
jgi:hypothetical protein